LAVVQVEGERIQVLFRYPEKKLGKKQVQQGVQVIIQRPAQYDGDSPQILGESLRFCDSRDRFNRIKGRREGLIRALDNAGFTRSQRLDVWDWFQATCRVLEEDRFVSMSLTVHDADEARIGVPRGFMAGVRDRIAAFKKRGQANTVGV
jgi:hypothetical protein